MKKQSIWKMNTQSTKTNQPIPTKTDILIIGAGIAGMSCAYFLKDSKRQITLIDRSIIGNGVTSKTTGKISYIQSDIYSKLTKVYGEEVSLLYLQSQKEAYRLVKEIIEKHHIDCKYEVIPSYLFTLDNKQESTLQKEKDFLEHHGVTSKWVKKLPISFPIEKGFVVSESAYFHPIQYLLELKKICQEKIDIFENVTALEIIPHQGQYIVKTEKQDILCNDVIVTTHYPFFTLPGYIPFKTHIEREYVIASKQDSSNGLAALSLSSPVHSIRFYHNQDSYMIYGGYNHKLGNKTNEEENYDQHIQQFKQYFSTPVDYIWNTHDIMTDDYLPLIGSVNQNHPNLYIATGFGKWGMTNGTLAGKIISDLINHQENPYAKLLRPDRKINLEKAKNFIINGFHTGVVFTQTALIKNKSFYPKNIKLETKEGTSYGIYIDEHGKVHQVINKCPHLHCALTFNVFDKTWDCPCHGSRFDIDGNCIMGPSTASIKIKKD